MSFLFILLLSVSQARSRSVHPPSAFPTPNSVLWVGAHPDDESIAAPLLRKWCVDDRARCTLLIATRGESGACLRSDGCLPDIATVRSAEAGAASEYFDAGLILLNFPDGGGSAPPPWAHAALLTTTLADYIQATHPDLILTFDPRHGATCHPDHRAVADGVLGAVSHLASPPAVYFLETRVAIASDPFAIHFTPAMSAALRFDATSSWSAVTDDMQRHASQFDLRWIAAVETVPEADRAVSIAPAAIALGQNVTPCP